MKKFFKDKLPQPDDIKKYKALGILGESIFEKNCGVLIKILYRELLQ